ncbi:MAG: histidine phosphatase family protein [Cyclobacteriaceae bacterium]
MKKLYIVRHAKSSWDYPELTDEERPLNKRGKRDAPRMAEHVADKVTCPDVFVSSHAERAFKTSIEFAKAFGLSEKDITQTSELYHASESAWKRVVSQINDAHDSAMLFGHNPGITYFVNQLSRSNIFNIPTCGVAGIALDIDSWQEISNVRGKLDFYYYPKGI